MFLGWLPPEWIKQLLRNPLLRKTLHLRKRKLTCCHLLFECTFYSAIPFIALPVVLYFYYPVNSKHPHNSKNIVFCTEWRNRTLSYGFGDHLATIAYSIYVTPVRLELTTPSLKVMCSNQLSYEVNFSPSWDYRWVDVSVFFLSINLRVLPS